MGEELKALLRDRSAEAETVKRAPRRQPRSVRRRWPPEGPIGYTGAYVERKESLVQAEPFVARLLARGPY